MTQEQKTKLERAAKDFSEIHRQPDKPIRSSIDIGIAYHNFMEGAQTILDNYHDYGLQSMEKYKDMVSSNVRLGAENTRYRQALESIAARWNKVAEHNEMKTALHLIQQDVFEALKNNEG